MLALTAAGEEEEVQKFRSFSVELSSVRQSSVSSVRQSFFFLSVRITELRLGRSLLAVITALT